MAPQSEMNLRVSIDPNAASPITEGLSPLFHLLMNKLTISLGFESPVVKWGSKSRIKGNELLS